MSTMRLSVYVQGGPPLRLVLENLGWPQASDDDVGNIQGVEIRFKGVLVRKAVDIPSVLQFIVDFSTGVEGNLFALWLVEKFVDKPIDRIEINGREVHEISVSRVQEMLEEELRR